MTKNAGRRALLSLDAAERASVLTLLLQEHPQLLDRPSMRRSTDPCSEDSESLMPEKKT